MKSIILALCIVLILAGCVTTSKINDVKNSENVGKTVSVSGTVKNVVSIGDLSFYELEDETGSINVSTLRLPAVGDKLTIQGTLIHDSLVGYYIKIVS